MRQLPRVFLLLPLLLLAASSLVVDGGTPTPTATDVEIGGCDDNHDQANKGEFPNGSNGSGGLGLIRPSGLARRLTLGSSALRRRNHGDSDAKDGGKEDRDDDNGEQLRAGGFRDEMDDVVVPNTMVRGGEEGGPRRRAAHGSFETGLADGGRPSLDVGRRERRRRRRSLRRRRPRRVLPSTAASSSSSSSASPSLAQAEAKAHDEARRGRGGVAGGGGGATSSGGEHRRKSRKMAPMRLIATRKKEGGEAGGRDNVMAHPGDDEAPASASSSPRGIGRTRDHAPDAHPHAERDRDDDKDDDDDSEGGGGGGGDCGDSLDGEDSKNIAARREPLDDSSDWLEVVASAGVVYQGECKTKSCCLTSPSLSTSRERGQCCDALPGYEWSGDKCKKGKCQTKKCCTKRKKAAKRRKRNNVMKKCCQSLWGYQWTKAGGRKKRCVANDISAEKSQFRPLPAGSECSEHGDCLEGGCGRRTYSSAAGDRVCCRGGKADSFLVPGSTDRRDSYCADQPAGATCRTDDMCASVRVGSSASACAYKEYSPASERICCPSGEAVRVLESRPGQAVEDPPDPDPGTTSRVDCIEFSLSDGKGNFETGTVCFDVGKLPFQGNFNDIDDNTVPYCTEAGVRTKCRINAQCSSQVCVAGTCRSRKGGGWDACDEGSDCLSGMCGRAEYAAGARRACCPGGAVQWHVRPDRRDETDMYCANLPVGSACHDFGSCAPGLACTSDGTCGELLPAGSRCDGHGDCLNGACGRRIFGSSSVDRVCCPSGATVKVRGSSDESDDDRDRDDGGGVVGEFDAYCTGQPAGARCHNDRMCGDANSRSSCGLEEYKIGARKVCCPSGEAVRVFRPGSNFDTDNYCTGQGAGQPCGRDVLCRSNVCRDGVCV